MDPNYTFSLSMQLVGLPLPLGRHPDGIFPQASAAEETGPGGQYRRYNNEAQGYSVDVLMPWEKIDKVSLENGRGDPLKCGVPECEHWSRSGRKCGVPECEHWSRSGRKSCA